MALFNVSVLATLNVPRELRDLLRQQVAATERVAAALETLVAKVTEPEGEPPLSPDQVAALTELNASQLAKAAALRAALTHPA